jgi:hypothetical protein
MLVPGPVIQNRDGFIWLATITGANRFHPRELNRSGL